MLGSKKYGMFMQEKAAVHKTGFVNFRSWARAKPNFDSKLLWGFVSKL